VTYFFDGSCLARAVSSGSCAPAQDATGLMRMTAYVPGASSFRIERTVSLKFKLSMVVEGKGGAQWVRLRQKHIPRWHYIYTEGPPRNVEQWYNGTM
jgi:hypothetical protein